MITEIDVCVARAHRGLLQAVPPLRNLFNLCVFERRPFIDPRNEWSIYSGWGGVLDFKLPPSQTLIG